MFWEICELINAVMRLGIRIRIMVLMFQWLFGKTKGDFLERLLLNLTIFVLVR